MEFEFHFLERGEATEYLQNTTKVHRTNFHLFEQLLVVTTPTKAKNMAAQHLDSLTYFDNSHRMLDKLLELSKGTISDKLPVGDDPEEWRHICHYELRSEPPFCDNEDVIDFIGNDATALLEVLEFAVNVYTRMGLVFDADLATMFFVCIDDMWGRLLSDLVEYELHCRHETKHSALLVLNRITSSEVMRCVYEFL